jgi:pyruvate formate lyase activating enzyme
MLEAHESLHPGRWWRTLEDGRSECFLCPRKCALRPGQRAFCYVRIGTEEGVALTTYGRSSGFCIDPIEKKPLNHFYPGTPILSFGTAGCNLGCKFCQNWDISKARNDDRLMNTASPERIVEAAAAHHCTSIAFTYNDPVIFAEYALDTAAVARAAGLKSVAVTAGYISAEARPEFFRAMDAANIDLKAFTEDFYTHMALGHLEPVKESIEFAVNECGTWVELTVLLIPGANDGPKEISEMCAWILDKLGPKVPLHFTAFHPDFKLTDRERTPVSTLQAARKISKDMGIHHVYTGNVHDAAGASTYCHACEHRLIERDWYVLGSYGIKQGACEKCGELVPGRFNDTPGTWGAKRQRLSMD